MVIVNLKGDYKLYPTNAFGIPEQLLKGQNYVYAPELHKT